MVNVVYVAKLMCFLYQVLYEVDQLNIIMVLNYAFVMCLSFFQIIFLMSLIISSSHILFFIIKFPKLLTPRKTNTEPVSFHPVENKENHLPNHHSQVPAVNLPGCKLFQTSCHFINGCFFGSFIYIAHWVIFLPPTN